MDLWKYQKKLFADPTGCFAQNILDEHVHKLHQTANKVRQEAHLLTGFVRFQTTVQGISFAAIEPSYNVVELLAPHFCQRFPNQDWLIVDTRRGTAIHYEQGELRSVHLSAKDLPLQNGSLRAEIIDEDEERFRELWQTYHKAITIPERKNLRLMTRLLPRKYWKYLPEKSFSKNTSQPL
jgi:probable DNA metabolism protein